MFGHFSLSTMVCQDYVLFYCNATLYTNSGNFGWFLNDRSIFMELFQTNFSYPYQSSTSLYGSTIRIQNVTRVYGIAYEFENFVLSTPIEILEDYVGQNLTCGQSQYQSSPIIIGNYSNRSKLTFLFQKIMNNRLKI